MRKFTETPRDFDEQMHRITQSLKEQGLAPIHGLAGAAFLERYLRDARQRMT